MVEELAASASRTRRMELCYDIVMMVAFWTPGIDIEYQLAREVMIEQSCQGPRTDLKFPPEWSELGMQLARSSRENPQHSNGS